MSLLAVAALVGAVIKVDLRNNMVDGSSGAASSVASGVACPPHWLPVVLGAGILPQSPAADKSEEPNRGRLLSHGNVCANDPSLACKGQGQYWYEQSKCCARCAKPGAMKTWECKHPNPCGCSKITALILLRACNRGHYMTLTCNGISHYMDRHVMVM